MTDLRNRHISISYRGYCKLQALQTLVFGDGLARHPFFARRVGKHKVAEAGGSVGGSDDGSAFINGGANRDF